MAKERILVVDDEEDILELVRFHLAREGYQVTLAATGEEALKKAKHETFDLVVLDLMLPGLDGLEVGQGAEGRRRTDSVPIVMLTAKGEDADVVTGLEIGADDYVTKPFSPRVLTARVKAVLRRRSQAAAGRQQGPHGSTSLRSTRAAARCSPAAKPLDLTYTEFQLLHRPGAPAGLGLHPLPDRRRRARQRLPGHRPQRGRPGGRPAQEARGLRRITSRPCAAWATASRKRHEKTQRKLVWRSSVFSYIFIALGALVAAGWYFTPRAGCVSSNNEIAVELFDRAAPRLKTRSFRIWTRPIRPPSMTICKRTGKASEHALHRHSALRRRHRRHVGNAPEHGQPRHPAGDCRRPGKRHRPHPGASATPCSKTWSTWPSPSRGIRSRSGWFERPSRWREWKPRWHGYGRSSGSSAESSPSWRWG